MKKKTYLPLVSEQTIPTERQPLVSEVSAIFFFADSGVSRVQRDQFQRPHYPFSRLEPLLFLPSSS
jgi:hypothetical protein